MTAQRRSVGNAVSAPSLGMSRLLLGGRPTKTLCATEWGVTHMVHASELREWTNAHGARFVEWSASCGAKGTKSGHPSLGTCSSIHSIDYAHKKMLCPDCCAGILGTRDKAPASIGDMVTTTDAPLRTVCTTDATSHPAAVKLANIAGDHGWTTQLTTEGDTITLRLSRGDEHGHAAWARNAEGAWRYSTCLIAGRRYGAREIPTRLACPVDPPVATAPTDPPLATVTPIRPEPVVTPVDAAHLAPVPPHTPAPAGGVMPSGTLATFMAAPVKAQPVNGNTEWANRYAHELRTVIYHAGRTSPRSLQVHLGPSELGVPCDRQVVGKLAGVPSVNHIVDPWPAILGTAGHAWLAEAFKGDNALRGLRWVPECRVTPHSDHPGTADLYDGHEQAVVDWKILAHDRIESIAAKGPSMQYQIQLLLYGRGYRNLGLPVRRVVLVALPRTKSTLDDMYVWDHEWTQTDDDAIEEVFKLTAIRKSWADEIRTGRSLLSVPATPDTDTCYFCPFYRPANDGTGCPGTAH